MSRPDAARRVPWHRSLVVRLFALGALIALVAVAAATWATVRATTVAVQEEQQESLHADAQTYDALIGYAATHRSWSGAQALVDRLARVHDGTVTVTDTSGLVLLTSGSGSESLSPDDARARLDPLDVDTALLDTSDRGAVAEQGVIAAPCDTPVTGARDCRPSVVSSTLALDPRVEGPFTREQDDAVYRSVAQRVDACLARAGLPSAVSRVTVDLDVVVSLGGHRRVIAGCLDEALRTVLSPYVAPPALLHVTGEGSRAEVFWDLSGRNQTRIALLAATIAGPLRRMAATAIRRSGPAMVAASSADSSSVTSRTPPASRAIRVWLRPDRSQNTWACDPSPVTWRSAGGATYGERTLRSASSRQPAMARWWPT